MWNNYYRIVIAGFQFTRPDPSGLAGGMNRIPYAGGNPLTYIDPFGLDPKTADLGGGWTGGIDMIPNSPGQFEIHAFDKSGKEVGMYGPNEWFDKHGHKGTPPNCPQGVETQLKGQSVDILRRAGALPPKGEMNIKDDRWISERGSGQGTNGGVLAPGGGGGDGLRSFNPNQLPSF